jgi:DNA-binding NarL/FixJ family response regulator
VSVPIRVLIADDQQLVRSGFRMMLEAEGDIEVVGEAGDGEEAVDLARKLAPEVALLDLRMPRMDGIQATELIARSPGTATRVLVVTTFDADEYVYAALRAGASGFLLKDAPPEELAVAVRVIAAGEALLAPSVTRRLIEQFARMQPSRESGDLESLTERELEVLRLVARGLSNAEIAQELVIGETTVKTHVGNVLMKLGLRDRAQAVVVAYESGVVTPGRLQGRAAPPT